jgi:hypothetical protein
MTHWYHSMDLPGIGPVEGAWDLRGRFDDYIGHVDLAGKQSSTLVRQPAF